MKRILLLFATLFQIYFGIGQDDDFYYVELECKAVSNADIGMEGVSMKIYQAGKLVEENISDASGNYKKIPVFYNINLLIEFSKEGYVTKSIKVDSYLKERPKKFAKDNIFPCDFTMMKARKGVDYSIVSDQPIASIIVNKKNGSLVYDNAYINKRSKEIIAFYNKK